MGPALTLKMAKTSAFDLGKADEGTEGRLRTKQKLSPCELPPPPVLGGTRVCHSSKNLPTILRVKPC